MTDINKCTTEKYYIVFTASKHNNWMVNMLKPPFQHVYAVKKSKGGQFWIIINPLASHTEVDMVSIAEYPHIRLYTGEDAVILPVTATMRHKDRWSLCVINCVEIVKSLLGIRSFWIFTPKQLYNYLISAGEYGRCKEKSQNTT